MEWMSKWNCTWMLACLAGKHPPFETEDEGGGGGLDDLLLVWIVVMALLA